MQGIRYHAKETRLKSLCRKRERDMNKIKCCWNCKHLGSDYIYCEECYDEYEAFYCMLISRYYSEEAEIMENCHLYVCEKYEERPEPEPYIEKCTKCDNCENLSECKQRQILINISDICDTMSHYVPSPFSKCIIERDDVQ